MPEETYYEKCSDLDIFPTIEDGFELSERILDRSFADPDLREIPALTTTDYQTIEEREKKVAVWRSGLTLPRENIKTYCVSTKK
jgi:hypothetical protein